MLVTPGQRLQPRVFSDVISPGQGSGPKRWPVLLAVIRLVLNVGSWKEFYFISLCLFT